VSSSDSERASKSRKEKKASKEECYDSSFFYH